MSFIFHVCVLHFAKQQDFGADKSNLNAVQMTRQYNAIYIVLDISKKK